MGVELALIHWIYVLFIGGIILLMALRRDTSLLCIVGVFIIAIISTESLTNSVSGVFNSFIYAIGELLPTILIICIIVSLSKVLTDTGINDVMVYPFTKMMKTPALRFGRLVSLMMISSWFFWPSPGVALLGAVLLPAAIRVGLPGLRGGDGNEFIWSWNRLIRGLCHTSRTETNGRCSRSSGW